MTVMIKIILILFIGFFLLNACKPKQSAEVDLLLQRVERCMDEAPDSALNLLKSVSESTLLQGELRARYCLLKVQARDKNDIDITSDDSLLTIASDYYLHTKDNYRKAQSLLYWGRMYEDRQDRSKAASYFLRALDLLENTNADEFKGVLCGRLGGLYLDNRLYGEALKLQKRSYSYFSKIESKDNMALSLRNVARVYMRTHQTDSMISYYGDAIHVAEQYGTSKILNPLLSETGYALMKEGKHDLAVQYVKRSLLNMNSKEDLCPSYLMLGFIYWDKKEYNEARNWLLKSISSDRIRTNYEAYQVLSEIEGACGNYQKAFEYQKLVFGYRDAIEKEEKKANLLEIQQKYENEKLRNKAQQAEYLILKQRFIILLIIAIAILLFAFCFWLYFHNKQRHTKELERINLKLRGNYQEIDSYQRKLNASEQKAKDATMTSLISLFQRIKYHPSPLTEKKDWELLRQFEDMYYNSFAKKLSEFKTLTLREEEVCLLLRLGLDNPDMAKILCIEPQTVTKYKMRAKEKISSSFPRTYSLYDMLLSI